TTQSSGKKTSTWLPTRRTSRGRSSVSITCSPPGVNTFDPGDWWLVSVAESSTHHHSSRPLMLDAVRAMRSVVVEEHRAHVAGIASVTVRAWRYRRCRRGRFAFTLFNSARSPQYPSRYGHDKFARNPATCILSSG